MSKDLTACLLVYNHAHVLREAIESIIAQTYINFNLIISDDCSTDNSYEIAKEYEKDDQNVLVIKTQINLGMAGNANFAAGFVKTKYFAFLHHDDLLDRDCFEKWIKQIEKDNEISFVFNDYRHGDRISHRISNVNFPEIIEGKRFLVHYLLKNWGSPIRGTALIRKSFYDKVGGMNLQFGMLADVDLWMRLASISKIGYVPEPLITVRQARLENYPDDYTKFSWNRIFILFDIHANNINVENYPKKLNYHIKNFAFRNRVSFQIIKWHLYAIIKNKREIIKSYPINCQHELIYSKLLRAILNLVYN